MPEKVLTATTYCNFLKTLPLWAGGTGYRASLPWNCLYLDNNNVLWADCNNLVKATIWGKATIPPMGNNWYSPGLYGLGDLTCDQLINSCEDISTDFTDMTPAEIMFMAGSPDHIGSYVGDFVINIGGQDYNCNCVEATAGFEGGILATYVDSQGRRYNGQGGAYGGTWDKHGKLPWIEYASDDEWFWLYMARRIRNYI